jgi:hypothetical protein
MTLGEGYKPAASMRDEIFMSIRIMAFKARRRVFAYNNFGWLN